MASLQAIYRQVEREGKRWGLVPIMRDGKVAVAEMVWELPRRDSNHVVAPVKAPRVICSFDESSPMDAFAILLRNRASRHRHDFMKLVRARQERLAAEQMAEIQQRRKDLRAEFEKRAIRGRIMFGGGARR